MCEQNKDETKLNCTEAQNLLKTMDHHQDGNTMKKSRLDAVQHFYNCADCKNKGLPAITGIKISCKEVIELAVADKRGWLLYHGVDTLRELTASEHLWGRGTSDESAKFFKQYDAWSRDESNVKNPSVASFFKHGCNEPACKKLRDHIVHFEPNIIHALLHPWRDPLTETHILFAIPLFVEQGWSVSKLFDDYDTRISSTENYREQKIAHDRYDFQKIISLVNDFKDRLANETFNCEEAFKEALAVQNERYGILYSPTGEK